MESDSQKGAKHLTDEDFKETIANSEVPVLVDFYAEWCGPCQMAAPIIDKLADEYRDKILITKLNVDENKDAAGEYGVMSIPTVIIFKSEEGKIEPVAKQVGFPGEDGYRNMIDKAL